MRRSIADAMRWGVPALRPSTLRLLTVVLPVCSTLTCAATVCAESARRETLQRELRSTVREIDRIAAQSHVRPPADHDD